MCVSSCCLLLPTLRTRCTLQRAREFVLGKKQTTMFSQQGKKKPKQNPKPSHLSKTQLPPSKHQNGSFLLCFKYLSAYFHFKTRLQAIKHLEGWSLPLPISSLGITASWILILLGKTHRLPARGASIQTLHWETSLPLRLRCFIDFQQPDEQGACLSITFLAKSENIQ